MLQSEKIFSPDGLLAEHLDHFRYRPQQEHMGMVVEAALKHSSRLIIEAGTGVGKTFAYLVPALLSKQKVVISTGTRHLQDQLYFKDLPAILDIVKIPVSTALLKGRSNYLCVHRLEHHAPRIHANGRQAAKKFQTIQDWSLVTRTGEIAEVNSIGEGDPVWPSVTSTVENCLGSECPSYQQCHVVKARRKALQADVVIINHHLFFSDLTLKQEGFGDLLPQADAFILDEAHQLPELASTFLATTTSSRQLKSLGDDVIAAQLEEAPESDDVREIIRSVQKWIADFQLALVNNTGRRLWREAAGAKDIEDQFTGLCTAIGELSGKLAALSERGTVLARCAERCERHRQHLQHFVEIDEDTVNWIEGSEKEFKLHSTPLVIADLFQSLIEDYPCSWIFTSATLTVNARFDHFQQQLGFGDAETIMLDSPYDYEANTRLFLPLISVDPGHDGYTQSVVDAVLPILEANKGCAFLLFSSHRALRAAAGILRGNNHFNFLVQGEAPRRELLDRFVKTEHAVLLGTSSFWEGVDIRGRALSCVVIDKLPFAAPDDPVLAGRLQAMRRHGENPFMLYQLPQAVLALKQGVGRLIRDEDDYGVVTICDPRLTAKPYGKSFIQSLPDMPRTSSLDEVIDFLQQHDSRHEAPCH
ncbi:MAG: ATP-dependent DNA helicase [Gammaproteobacteria bacterium]|nr:ATP-dependent DNA helicase [Gammaproteobacteria bacterium]